MSSKSVVLNPSPKAADLLAGLAEKLGRKPNIHDAYCATEWDVDAKFAEARKMLSKKKAKADEAVKEEKFTLTHSFIVSGGQVKYLYVRS